ncbi:MAG TPA: 3-phosphoshikimate 1-carboxyvinyltransferase, partial [Eubacteriales bacterium]|nr:3-phosphoshikimate 1-carboxyvinyltransferase [Eubacteriales bacterium]
ALILAAIADKPSTFNNIGICDDVLSTAGCLVKLGAKITFDGEKTTVIPFKKSNNDVILDCGNSGTTARLLGGLVSGLGIKAKFVGDKSLANRPIRIIEPLTAMGAKITQAKNCLFEINPSVINGINFQTPFVSAQLKSAVLLASLNANGETTVIEKVITRKHTENMLKTFGGNISENIKGLYNEITVKKSSLKGVNMTVPNDFSTAAFLLPLGLKYGIKIENVLLSKERTGFLRVLEKAGAKIKEVQTGYFCGEPTGDITVYQSEIKPFIVEAKDVSDMIDEIPIACVTACLANGVSEFHGLGELKYKESDRIRETANLINSIGCSAEILDDGLIVRGNGKIIGGTVNSNGDHRIAMSAVTGGILSSKGVTVNGAECIGVSSRNFLKMLGLE